MDVRVALAHCVGLISSHTYYKMAAIRRQVPTHDLTGLAAGPALQVFEYSHRNVSLSLGTLH